MDNLVPFPVVKEPSEVEVQTPGTAEMQDSVLGTQSSKLTSSDKLSALPQERPRGIQAWRNYRHSLDLETIRHDSWGPRRAGQMREGRASRETSPSGKETPKQRISFDSERGSQPTTRRVGQAFSKLVGGRASDPSASPNPNIGRPPLSSPPPSGPHSRAASPLRMFHQWSSGIHRTRRGHHMKEEPFIPVNPFKNRRHRKKFTLSGIISPPPTPDTEVGGIQLTSSSSSSSGAYQCDEVVPVTSIKAFFEDAQMFVTDSLPRQLYLNLLLRIPAMYFSRVARIFEEAEVSRPEIERMIDVMCNDKSAATLEGPTRVDSPPRATSHPSLLDSSPLPLPFPDEWTPTSVSPSLYRFKYSWEAFIDSLIREWKTLNVVSALLSSAILSIFQVPEAAEDPVTRTLALLSLVSALMSLSYGCMYIVRFASMRSMFRASKWAEEARKTKTLIWWNVWVMLAMPAVWISWAMLFFLSSILSFVWRTGSEADPEVRPPLSRKAALGPRIAITLVFALGMIYLLMIIRTLKRYGTGPHGGSMQGLLQAGSSSAAQQQRERLVISPGAGSLQGQGASLSRIRTAESDASEQRGRKRQRMEYPPRELSVGARGRRSKSLKNGEGEKDGAELEEFDMKSLGVVSVQLPDRSVESV
ncbi:hypothetical protein DFP72DRAFT_124143 [Ephemerocybe angulata]|uniref:Uncharacterized protein n=1 Tax=Ephemerocybe angulata TaxID=980116 RepID=A0A8H6HD09_9AGAR|nr:hypothetical protein DFP72DRAFT_124143 [Tulosesus angulatus]